MVPYYLFEPDDPIVNKHKEWFEMLKSTRKGSLVLPVSKHQVKNETILDMAEPLLCIQHYPSYMNQFVLKTDLKFQKAANKDLYYSGYDWLSNKAIKWLSKLHRAFPPIPFFLKDQEMRLYTVMGDYFIEGKIPFIPLSANMGRMFFDSRLQLIMANRLITFSSFFYVFCLGTGYNPIPAIQTVFDSFQFDYDAQNIKRLSEINIYEGNPYGLSDQDPRRSKCY